MNYHHYNPRQAALDSARTLLENAARAAMAAGTLPQADLPAFIVEIPADVKNGDVASNLAMAGARAFRKAPRQIAEAVVGALDLTGSLTLEALVYPDKVSGSTNGAIVTKGNSQYAMKYIGNTSTGKSVVEFFIYDANATGSTHSAAKAIFHCTPIKQSATNVVEAMDPANSGIKWENAVSKNALSAINTLVRSAKSR